MDRTIVVEHLAPGSVHRAVSTHVAAGGKGLNVARALKQLEVAATALGILGGYSGKMVAALASAEGIDALWTWADGETRTAVIVADEDGEATVFNEPGVPTGPTDWGRFVDDARSACAGAEVVTVSGSFPPRLPDGAVGALIAAINDGGATPWVDTSGAWLEDAIASGAVNIKISDEEAAVLLGFARVPADSEARIAWASGAVAAIRDRGIDQVIVTVGARGAVMGTGSGTWLARAPTIHVVNPTGSGDSMLAGLVGALSEGSSIHQALATGVACGSANAETATGASFTNERIQELTTAVEVVTL